MQQVIEWKKLPKDLDTLDHDYYHFKGSKKHKHEAPSIVTGRLWTCDGLKVLIMLNDTDVRVPLSYFTHYAEVE